MKKCLLTGALALCTLPAWAQLNGSGFYRVQNYATERYITIIDDYGKIDIASTTADMGAIETKKPFDRIVADPAAVIYFDNAGGTFYDLRAQGTGLVELLDFHLNLPKAIWENVYRPSVTYAGITAYLFDRKNTNDVGQVLSSGSDQAYSYWRIIPVAEADGQYLGIAPSLKVGDAYYQTYYAEYAFSANDARTKFYTVEKVANGVAVWKEVVGEVPTETPVIVGSSSSSAADNKITPKVTSTASVGKNQLRGVYFCHDTYSGSPHYKVTKYKAATMRVLGKTKDGSLGFVKTTEELIPANTAYLSVPEGTPDELKLMTEAEYQVYLQELKEKEDEERRLNTPVTLTANSLTVEYGEPLPSLTYSVEGTLLSGTPVLSCEAKQGSPAGIYPIVIAAGSVENRQPTLVNGTLTITKAALTITADNKTKKQGEAVPALTATYKGFKNGETSSVLTTQPTLVCEVTASTPPGDYQISVSGATAQNYSIAYQAGVFTVTEADKVTFTAENVTVEYGEAMPHLTWKREGAALQGGNPVITCEAVQGSPAGTYAIVISKGGVENYNDHYVNGTLTITRAPLTVSVGNYTREEHQENPAFELTYSGFKMNDDASALMSQPVATCAATADSPAGEYEIVVSGGESANYDFIYNGGMLTVSPYNAISDTSVRIDQHVYTLSGRRIDVVGGSVSMLPRGVYIVNGRKVAVK